VLFRSWHQVVGGGGSGSDSGFQVVNTTLAGGIPIAKFVDGSGHRYILYDTTGSHPGGIATNAGAQKKIDSISAVISGLLSAKFGLTDTGYTHTLSSVYTLRKVSDSLAAVFVAGLGTKFSLADTGYTKTLASINTLAKVRDSLIAINNSALAGKVTNSGGAKILGSGTYASIPSASTGPGLYYATDSGYFFYSNGSTWTSTAFNFYGRQGVSV